MKKDKKLLVSWVLGLVYAVYIIMYFANGVSSSSGAEQTGAALAGMIVAPHMVAVVIAVIFNILGWHKNSKGFTLTAAILYTISIVLFPIYFMFVIIQMILSFVGYSSIKKQQKEAI